MLELPPHHIHLWLAFPDEIQDADLLRRYQALLTPDEQLRQRRFIFGKDRHRYLVTRALVRTVLSRYAPLAPEQWAFAPNAHGKPLITNSEPQAQSLLFSVSHTQGLIALGVRRDGALGVDVEQLRSRPTALDIAQRFFSNAESQALAQLPPALQTERFLEYWTLKEAYFKARGLGLFAGLDQLSFESLPDQRVCLTLSEALQDDPARWRFWRCRPSLQHVIAVCAEQRGEQAQQLLGKKVVPLGAEQVLEIVQY